MFTIKENIQQATVSNLRFTRLSLEQVNWNWSASSQFDFSLRAFSWHMNLASRNETRRLELELIVRLCEPAYLSKLGTRVLMENNPFRSHSRVKCLSVLLLAIEVRVSISLVVLYVLVLSCVVLSRTYCMFNILCYIQHLCRDSSVGHAAPHFHSE